MTQENITIPLPKPVVEFYGREAKSQTKLTKKFISRAAVMRGVLENHVKTASKPCQQTPSVKTPATSR